MCETAMSAGIGTAELSRGRRKRHVPRRHVRDLVPDVSRADLSVWSVAMRLNAFLARAGVASRRRADELIKAGRVTVNGAPGQLNTVVGKNDRVAVDGKEVARQRLAYVLLHKPTGVVTTAKDPQGRRTVVDLVRSEPRVVPVGRLDVNTTGALLLTNDGPLAHRLAHPRYGVEKTYVAAVVGDPTDAALAALRDGVELEDGRTAPARVRRLAPGRVELVIHEGRNHQVRRMLEAVGHPVNHLHRSLYAGLTIEGLEPGSWRELTAREVEQLRRTAQPPA
jgi:23S rRNA pseudouridine2605 synthase